MSLSHQLLQEDALFNWRKKAWNLFEQIGLPKPKQEAFQYLSLQKLVLPNAASRREISLKEIEPHFLPECAGRLVFIDGFF